VWTRGIAAAVVVLISSVAAGCNSGDDDAEKNGGGKSSARGAQTIREQGGGSIMFVQTAQGGTLRRSGTGGLRLELQGVDKHSVFFSDRPVRESGVITTQELLPLLYGPRTPPPNAALVVNDGRPRASRRSSS